MTTEHDRIMSHRRAAKKYRTKNYEWIRQKQNEKNRYNTEERRNKKLQQRYGLTIEDYEKILKKQNGGCWICGKTSNQGPRKLNIDHNHTTGKVRGILCYKCNGAIGMFDESLEFLQRAIKYLKKNE